PETANQRTRYRLADGWRIIPEAVPPSEPCRLPWMLRPAAGSSSEEAMYAVIKTGGKQHRVKPGDVIEVELIHAKQGESITVNPLLVVDDDGKSHFGKELSKAKVKAKLVSESKG